LTPSRRITKTAASIALILLIALCLLRFVIVYKWLCCECIHPRGKRSMSFIEDVDERLKALYFKVCCV
ncbi:hypothetical protein, partial [Pseudomonas viridiflava]|uniref:hypothetical protein n=1 Tax=Pseudomonas viridiflava TaxID=33069 RepID=UPI0019D07B93